MSSDKVSVIIPAYNAKDFIENTITDLLNQSYKNIEIIVVDDGSSDGTHEICKKYQSENVICVRQENAGPSNARNNGLKIASGKYVLFLDSDDYLDKQAISKLISTADDNKVDVVICGFSYISETSVQKVSISCERGVYEQDQFADIIPGLLKNGVLSNIGTKLYLKEILVNNKILFDEEYKIYEDTTFCLSVLKYSSSIFCIEDCLYNYRLMPYETLRNTYKENYYQSVLKYIEVLQELLLKNGRKQCNLDFFCQQTNFLKIGILKNYINLKYKHFRKVCCEIYQNDIFSNSYSSLENLSLNKKVVLFLFKNRQFRLIQLILNLQKRIALLK